MPASLAMQAALAVKTLLTVPPLASVAAVQVRTEPIFPADVESGTALNIELGTEGAPQMIVIGLKDRDVELKLTAIAVGNNAVADADAVMVEVHARLMADATLGGLAFDILEQNTARENAAAGKRLALIEKSYLVNYRTSEASL